MELKSRAKREKCQVCGNMTFKNNFLLSENRHARVFVECAECGALVARYILHAYVDPNYTYGSTLKMLSKGNTYGDSMRNLAEDLSVHQERAKTQFSQLKQRIEEEDDNSDERIIEIIQEMGIVEDG